MIVTGLLIIAVAFYQLVVWGTLLSGGLAIILLVFGSWCLLQGFEYYKKGGEVSHDQGKIQEKLRMFDYKNDPKNKV